MTTLPPEAPARPEPTPAPRARPIDVAVLFCLAGAGGAALVAQIMFDLDMTWTAGLIALPGTALCVVAAFLGQRRFDRLAIVSDRLVAGAIWGLAATLVYDVVRPIVVWAFGFDFHPYKAHALFGELITDRPHTTAFAITVGWIYHFWNGISFGTMLALVKPKAGAVVGWAWGLGLQGLMMIVYPNFLQVRLDQPSFMVTTIVGHSAYGLSLGWFLARRGPA